LPREKLPFLKIEIGNYSIELFVEEEYMDARVNERAGVLVSGKI
jgi:hypothetical protein